MSEHLRFEPTGNRAARVVEAVEHAQDAQRKLTARGRAQLGIGGTDIAVLQYVARAREHSVTVAELAGWLDLTRAAASMASKRLVEAGYLQRIDDESDGRRRWLALTPRGREAIDDAFGPADREATALVDRLEDSVIDTLIDTLEKMAAVFEQAAPAQRSKQRRDV
ncbi:DNA-binding MarR family transcriptional regulator [Rathayibacter sp. PhB151]|uniref:MarR family winged helix-turn-helix transcriptional regulator n=1 Tax=Rathayibacter sp. PhB151 TaxID=2485189 RepID=UPI0010E2F5FF|nr:MarR family transcriptional regulator [Rathayibacter sp. PhB151]TDX79051.1 DNA-binding MarR family transcriptional regulator [Rathayibacter sp. PhB151]